MDAEIEAAINTLRNLGEAIGKARPEETRELMASIVSKIELHFVPGTGRRIAREVRQPYSGSASLTDKTTNIRFGTIFLKKMLERFDDNQVLATAAYNAGPLSVEDWLPDSGQIDARIWIENIPYDETRQYVRRVLTAERELQQAQLLQRLRRPLRRGFSGDHDSGLG